MVIYMFTVGNLIPIYKKFYDQQFCPVIENFVTGIFVEREIWSRVNTFIVDKSHNFKHVYSILAKINIYKIN